MAAPTPKPDYPVRPHQISPEAPLAERLVPTPEAIAAMEERQQASALDRRRDTRAEGIIARRVALSLGLVRYQGRPCRYGHDGVRYASSTGCVACIAASALRRTGAVRPAPRARPAPAT